VLHVDTGKSGDDSMSVIKRKTPQDYFLHPANNRGIGSIHYPNGTSISFPNPENVFGVPWTQDLGGGIRGCCAPKTVKTLCNDVSKRLSIRTS
jgi:hypothetical protein